MLLSCYRHCHCFCCGFSCAQHCCFRPMPAPPKPARLECSAPLPVRHPHSSGRQAGTAHLFLGGPGCLLLCIVFLCGCQSLPAAVRQQSGRPQGAVGTQAGKQAGRQPAEAAAAQPPGRGRRAHMPRDHYCIAHLSTFLICFRCLALSFLRCAAVSFAPFCWGSAGAAAASPAAISPKFAVLAS